MDDDRISLAHGNGGRFMRELIEDVFATALSASELDVQADAVQIDLGEGEVMITTDGFSRWSSRAATLVRSPSTVRPTILPWPVRGRCT